MIVFVLLPVEQQTPTHTHHYSHIECDVPDCGVHAPRPSEMQGGLMHMGWFVAPGQHRCPKHFHDEVPARGPQYRSE